jgi:hypothetical protein
MWCGGCGCCGCRLAGGAYEQGVKAVLVHVARPCRGHCKPTRRRDGGGDMDSSADQPIALKTASPVSVSDRVGAIDVLPGHALCGVMAIDVRTEFRSRFSSGFSPRSRTPHGWTVPSMTRSRLGSMKAFALKRFCFASVEGSGARLPLASQQLLRNAYTTQVGSSAAQAQHVCATVPMLGRRSRSTQPADHAAASFSACVRNVSSVPRLSGPITARVRVCASRQTG